MVIEFLTFHVPLTDQPAFIAADAAIWTATLSCQPGYLGKDIWRDKASPDSLRLVIRWASRNAWRAVPRALLDQTNADFVAALGQSYPVLSCTEFDVI
jgi:uncharacterized protein (TIGR03792 family)